MNTQSNKKTCWKRRNSRWQVTASVMHLLNERWLGFNRCRIIRQEGTLLVRLIQETYITMAWVIRKTRRADFAKPFNLCLWAFSRSLSMARRREISWATRVLSEEKLSCLSSEQTCGCNRLQGFSFSSLPRRREPCQKSLVLPTPSLFGTWLYSYSHSLRGPIENDKEPAVPDFE